MLDFVPIIAFLLIAFSIGTNDTSNAFGICIGCRVVSFRKATFLLFAFVIVGVLLQGDKVMRTVGKEITEVNVEISAISMAIAAIVIVFSNFRGLPVSSHQVIIGSLTGTAIAFGAQVSAETLFKIVLSWITSPIVAGILAVAIFFLLENFLRGFSLLQVNRALKVFLLCSAIIVAYNTGANELATAMAPVVHLRAFEPSIFAILGAFFLWFGAYVLSKRVIEVVCKGITALDPKSGLSAHLGAGIAVLSFTTLGMPVSTTYAMIGGIACVGFTKGVKAVRTETLKKIAVNWVLAPLLSLAISWLVTTLIIGKV